MVTRESTGEVRTLPTGEMVYFGRPPGGLWEIQLYEFGHVRRVLSPMGGGMLTYREGLPDEWRDLRFKTVEEGVAFVRRQIKEGEVPHNHA